MPGSIFQCAWDICACIPTTLRWALPRVPHFLWRCARNPAQTFSSLINFPGVLYRGAIPWLSHKLTESARFLMSREYWSRTEKQADSLFLTKLPSEIRNQIYELCFEHQKMLVVPVKRQSHTKLASFPAQDKHNHHPDDLVACDHLLGLPLTCKQIYAETIDMLYSRTTFCFMQPEQIVPFHKQLLPQRWNAITSIEFDSDLYHRLRKLDMDLPAHSFVHRSEAWLEFWSLVNTMESLERVVITRTKLGFRFENLAAMEQVKKRLEVFDVYLAETQIMCDPVDVDLKTAQFKLFLPSGQQYLADPPLSGPAGNYGGVMERMHQAWWQM